MNKKNNSKSKKIFFKIGIIILTLLIVFPTIAIIHLNNAIPDEITLSKDSNYSYNLLPFTSISRTQSNIIEADLSETPAIPLNTANVGNYQVEVNLFERIPLKNIDVNITAKKYVNPSGAPIGIKLHTDGVLVVGISYVTDENGNTVYPAKTSGIKSGDLIIGINGKKISSIDEMTSQIANTNGTFTLTLKRDDEILEKSVTAVKSSEDNSYKMGVWVRDSAAGVGTMTFYDPQTNKYASLGHAITDVDTGKILTVSDGKVLSCEIVSVNKGVKGTPGELIGSFTGKNIGKIESNTPFGVYGNVENSENIVCCDLVEVATRFQTNEGDAYILSDIDGNGIKKYSIEITKISKNSSDNKGIVFKVTDKALIAKTGGIVQGMSGSPIIQNNMLVGAVTHVFINEPTKGYGIFAENMIDMVNSIN